MIPVVLAALSLLISQVVWVSYMLAIPAGRVAERPLGSLAAQVVAIGLGLGAMSTWALGEGGGGLGVLALPMAAVGAFFGAFFLWLYSVRATPIGDLRVAEGDTLLPFTAWASTGERFDSAELGGQRVLLKFFRGGW